MTRPINFHPYAIHDGSELDAARYRREYAHNLMADRFVTLGSTEGPFNLITITMNPHRINIMYMVTKGDSATFDTHGFESAELVEGSVTDQLIAIFDVLDAIMITPVPDDDCDEYDECHVPRRLVDQFTTSEMVHLYGTVHERLWSARLDPPRY